eukprot:1350003-Karenia_brevis.AAC.1
MHISGDHKDEDADDDDGGADDDGLGTFLSGPRAALCSAHGEKDACEAVAWCTSSHAGKTLTFDLI